MKPRYLPYLLLCLLFAGCASWRDGLALKAGYEKKSRADAALVAAKQEGEQAVAKAKDDVAKDKSAVIEGKDKQIGATAKDHYGISVIVKGVQNPSREITLIDDLNEEGWANIGHPMPTYQELVDVNARIAKDLDATKTSLADLKAEHDKAMGEAVKLAADEKKAEADLSVAKDTLAKTQTDAQSKIDAKQKDVDEATAKTLALEHARADDAKAIQAFKAKVSTYAGIAALALLLGAVYSPVFKPQLGALAGLAFLIAGGVWYITGTVILVCAIIAGLGIAGWFIWEHNKGSKAELATYQALAEVKDKVPAVWAQIAPTLAAWQTKYVKAPDGTITTVPDPSISAHIDAKLMAVGDK